MSGKRKVIYRTPSSEHGFTGNYVSVYGSSSREAVQQRLKMLAGRSSCAEDAWFECDGERFPIRWDDAQCQWVLA